MAEGSSRAGRMSLALALVASALAASAAAPAFARERGSQIAFLRLTEPFWQVWVMSADGRRPRQVTRSPGDKIRISWFPGGRRLLYNVIPGQVWTVDLETGREARVPLELEGMTDAQVSFDGEWIAFSMTAGGGLDNNDLWVARSDGSQARRIVADQGLQHYPAWSPDGREIAFLSGEGKNDHDVWLVEVATGRTRRLTSGLLYNFDLALCADRRLALSSNRSGDYDIWATDAEGGAARSIAPFPGSELHPDWSPDCRRLLFTSARDGAPALWVVGIDGRGLRKLTPSDQRCRAGVFSR